MQTFKNVNGKTVFRNLYEDGIMKQIGQLDFEIRQKGSNALDVVYKAHNDHSSLNHKPIDIIDVAVDMYQAGYLEGIRAERARRKKKAE